HRFSQLMRIHLLRRGGRSFHEQRINAILLNPSVGKCIADSLDIERYRRSARQIPEGGGTDPGYDGAIAHRPTNLAGRFSAKARGPSLASSEERKVRATTCSSRNPVARSRSRLRIAISFAA